MNLVPQNPWEAAPPNMTGFVITVDFELKSGALPAFRSLVEINARHSCRHEPGCRRFDVLVSHGQENRVLLYEIYDSREAFDAHLNTQHFERFNRESSPLVVAKHVAEYLLACEGSHAAKQG